ncbi:hypothetical protein RLIN73S_07444 [Rhodanobacter lindaniclasticus]
MQHLDAHPQPFTQASHGLQRQANLRHQQQRLPALRQHLLDQRQVDLGLAAAGDAVEQERLVAAKSGGDGGDRPALLVTERGRHRYGLAAPWRRLLAAFEQAGGRQPARRLAPAALAFVQFRCAERAAGQQSQQAPTAAAATAGGVGLAAGGGDRPVFLADRR